MSFKEQKHLYMMQAMYLKITEYPKLVELLCKTDAAQIVYQSNSKHW